jgi:hypothetical protein
MIQIMMTLNKLTFFVFYLIFLGGQADKRPLLKKNISPRKRGLLLSTTPQKRGALL